MKGFWVYRNGKYLGKSTEIGKDLLSDANKLNGTEWVSYENRGVIGGCPPTTPEEFYYEEQKKYR